MPFTSVYTAPQLTEGDAWDVAAFICSQQRPEKFFNIDWKTVGLKPIDYPFGPYADSITSIQHKYGPFKAIQQWKTSVQQKQPALHQ